MGRIGDNGGVVAGAAGPCGLPLALGCRRLWRLRYRCAAWVAGTGVGAVTVGASLVAGLLGPVAIAAYAVVLSLPVCGGMVVADTARLTAEAGGPAAQQEQMASQA